MNITEYINQNWTAKNGLNVKVRRESDHRTFNLEIPTNNKWDVWAWSRTHLVIRASGKHYANTAGDTIYEGWNKINTDLVTYLQDFEVVT